MAADFRFPSPFPPAFASAWGDDAFGLWADFSLEFPDGEPIVQKLRWIEPGTFWMGSADDEPERYNDESPQHEVSISRGVWLADTVCTQALWLAVMGDNPSRLKGNPLQPVETVSWHEVQEFLSELQSLLLGCQVDLPSEAEWEYACRAGTTTPFSFGPQITPEQVNYNGNSPYVGGKPGEYRVTTVPVKSLPANAWGLYEMHGNVWEWCKDSPRTYGQQAQIDPIGPMKSDEEPRSVRGGSWSSSAGWARSAFRDAFLPNYAYRSLSFRFCLRAIESGRETDGRTGEPR